MIKVKVVIPYQLACLKTKKDFSSWWRYTPEGFVHRSVPADEGAGGEEERPEDGEAQAHATGGVHAEHGQGGDQVEEQRASADWILKKTFFKKDKKETQEYRRVSG